MPTIFTQQDVQDMHDAWHAIVTGQTQEASSGARRYVNIDPEKLLKMIDQVESMIARSNGRQIFSPIKQARI